MIRHAMQVIAVPRRRAFTLIELLVAMTLTLFTMTILSEAFTRGLDTFSGLKSIGDLEDNLRVAATNLRADLGEDHLNGKRRLSDPYHWTDRPRSGFLRIWHGSAPVATVSGGPTNHAAPYVLEWNPAPGAPSVTSLRSYRASNHVLHMLVKRKGNRLEDFFSATSAITPPPAAWSQFLNSKTDIFFSPKDATLRDRTNDTTFRSQWAEVAYFLVRNGNTADATNNNPTQQNDPLPTYKLYRLELAVVPHNKEVNDLQIPSNATSLATFKSVACLDVGGKLYFPSPDDYALPAPIRVFDPANAASYSWRASLVMNDVLSFQVQGLFRVPPQEIALNASTRVIYPGDSNQASRDFEDPIGRDYDSAKQYKESRTINGNPTPVDSVLQGIVIRVRAWDRGRGQARQVSIVQDL